MVITMTYLLYPTIFQFLYALTTVCVNKYRLLTDYTFHSWSRTVDIYALIFSWCQTTVPIG